MKKSEIEQAAASYAYKEINESEYNSRTDDMEYAFQAGVEYALSFKPEPEPSKSFEEYCKTVRGGDWIFENHKGFKNCWQTCEAMMQKKIDALDSALVMYLDAEDMAAKITCDKNAVRILRSVRGELNS